MFVYKITNLINSKIYIGSTINDVRFRWRVHVNQAFRREVGTAFQQDIRKFGAENFKVDVIDECDNLYELEISEDRHMQLFDSFEPNGYNKYGRALNPKKLEYNKRLLSKKRATPKS